MSLINWDDTMKVGVPSVDHEHEVLVGVINTLGDMIQGDEPLDVVKALLAEIHAQIEAHFALEEKIMLNKGYQGYHAHKEDHDRLLDEIRDIMEEVQVSTRADVYGKLGEQMNTWFSEHFRTLDRSFHTFIDGH